MMRVRPSVLLAMTLILWVPRPAQAEATVSTVRCDSGADLQRSIDRAHAGDTLYVQGTCRGLFAISKDLTLSGLSGATLDGGGLGTTLTVLAGKVRLIELTISGGKGDVGGGIHNAGDMEAVGATVTGNSAVYGGGVYNTGSLIARGSSISDNHTSSNGDAYDIGDGGVFNQGVLTLDRSAVTGNLGGGILSEAGATLTLDQSTVSQNASYQSGGVTSHGFSRIIDSTISANSVGVGSAAGVANGGRMTIRDSTISGNVNWNSSPAGVGNTGYLKIVASTISNNFSDDGPGGGIENFSYPYPGARLTIKGSVIAGNQYADCTGRIRSLGYNVIGAITKGSYLGCKLHPQPTDLVGTNAAPIDPKLKSLGPHGGPTETMPPFMNSVTVDAIPVGAGGHGGRDLCAPYGTVDQRGVPRPQGPACDIGSVEARQ